MTFSNRRFWLNFLVLLTIPLLIIIFSSGCNNENNLSQTQLSIPSPYFEDGTISWEPIDNASKYEYDLNGQVFTTYSNSVNLDISSTLASYSFKVKAISEDANYKNSEFSNVLEFDSLKLSTPSISSVNIDNDTNTVKVNLGYPIYQQEYIENIIFFINDNQRCTIKASELSQENSFTYFYQLPGELFSAGENKLSLMYRNTSEYILDSEISQTVTILKNHPHENVRVEDGLIKYGDDFIYTDPNGFPDEYDYMLSTQPFYVINYEGNNLRSDAVVVYVDKVRAPKISSCTVSYEENMQEITINLQCYDENFNGDKSLVGYFFDVLEVLTFDENGDLLNSHIFNVSCNDEETLNLSLPYNEWTYNKISVIAKKDGCLDSKTVTYLFNS